MADYLGKKIKFNIEDNDLQKIRFNKVYGESQQATRSGKNLFDKDNANIINTYIAGSGNGVLPSDGGAENKCVYIPCKQNTTYTIQKMIGKRFGVAYTYETPAQGVMAYNKTVDNNVASITITTDSSAKYLVVYLRNGNASGEITLQQALDSLQIEKGSTATDYEPYGVMPSPDYRSKIENLEGRNKFNYLWFDTTKEVDWTAYQSITSLAKAIPIFIGKGKAATFSSNVPLLSGDNLLYAINDLTKDTSASFALGKTQTVEANNEGYVYVGYIKSRTNYNKVKDGTYYVQVEEGTVATPYVPYNSLEFKDEGKNLVKQMNWKQLPSISTGATVTTVSGYGTDFIEVDNTKNYVFSYSGTASSRYIVYYDKNKNFLGYYTNLQTNNFAKWSETGYVRLRVDCPQDSVTAFQLEEGTVATDYEPYKSQTAYFPLGEEKLMEGSYLADDGIHHKRKQIVFDGSREYIRYTSLDSTNHNCFYTNQTDIYVDSTGTQTCLMSNYFKGDKFDNRALDIPNMWVNKFSSQIYFKMPNTITTVEELKAWLSNNPPTVEYELAEEEIVPYTEDQKEAWEKLRHFKGLNGENNITAQGTMTSTLDLTLYNVAEEDFDIYISKKGYFGALKYDINNLIDFTESNIPSIAEATESSVKIAGRDGDMPLNTVYEPLSFEIVCYTEDNLTPEEKIIEEQKITSLLNSIKNQTKTFFMEREKKFYKVKYSGNLSVVRYPKHLKFTIPLKSSESYAMNCEESEIIGNGIKISNTIKDTGAIFTIKGPAIKPIISLNNYQMKYNENILEGNSLIINSEDSTITHITSAGVKTNAMRAYNHEFPKIKNGENQLAVSSGIDDENQVNVKWYDLKI